jgi:hypothetical protein
LLTYLLDEEERKEQTYNKPYNGEKTIQHQNLKFTGNISYEKNRSERTDEQNETVIHHPALYKTNGLLSPSTA